MEFRINFISIFHFNRCNIEIFCSHNKLDGNEYLLICVKRQVRYLSSKIFLIINQMAVQFCPPFF